MLWVLVPLASGFRTASLGDDKPTQLLTTNDVKSFAQMEHPAIIPELVAPPGENITVEIQEHAQYMKAAEYSWYIAGKNGVPFSQRIFVGKLKSQAFQRKVVFRGCKEGKDCQKDLNRQDLFRIQASLNANPFKIKPPTFYVQSVAKKTPEYYTVVKQLMNRGRGHFGVGRRVQPGTENYAVYPGKCKKPPCGEPVMTASGHFKGWNYNFYKAGQDQPIAFMDVKSAKMGLLGVKQTFIMTISENIDSALLMAMVSIIDLVNNNEAAQ